MMIADAHSPSLAPSPPLSLALHPSPSLPPSPVSSCGTHDAFSSLPLSHSPAQSQGPGPWLTCPAAEARSLTPRHPPGRQGLRLPGWLATHEHACMPACLATLLPCCLAALLPCCLAALLPCCLADLPPCRLAAWLHGCLAALLPVSWAEAQSPGTAIDGKSYLIYSTDMRIIHPEIDAMAKPSLGVDRYLPTLPPTRPPNHSSHRCIRGPFGAEDLPAGIRPSRGSGNRKGRASYNRI